MARLASSIIHGELTVTGDIRLTNDGSGVFIDNEEVFHTGNFTDNSGNWNSAYKDVITGVSGDGDGTLTLTRRDGGTLTTSLNHSHGYGDLPISSVNVSNWNQAYNNYITGVSGNGDGTLTLSQRDGGSISTNLSHSHSEYVRSNANDTVTGLITIDVTGEALGIGTSSNHGGNDAWIRMGNGNYDWLLKYVGSTSGSGGNEFRIESDYTGNYVQFDHDGNVTTNGIGLLHDGNSDSFNSSGTYSSLTAGSISGDLHMGSNVISMGGTGSSNYDHFWFNDSSYGGNPGQYHFVADAAKKAIGNASIRAGGFFRTDGTEVSYSDHSHSGYASSSHSHSISDITSNVIQIGSSYIHMDRHLELSPGTTRTMIRARNVGSWTGDFSDDSGKIEYNSGRWYIASYKSGTPICQFRNSSGSNIVIVDDDGNIEATGGAFSGSVNIEANSFGNHLSISRINSSTNSTWNISPSWDSNYNDPQLRITDNSQSSTTGICLGHGYISIGTNSISNSEALRVRGGDVTAPDFVTTSDRKVKSNITKVDDVLDIFEPINLYSFQKEDKDNKEIGLIAQEVQEGDPLLTGTTEHEEYGEILTLSAHSVASLAVGGVKALKEDVDYRVGNVEDKLQTATERIDNLESKVNILTEENKHLRQKIENNR